MFYAAVALQESGRATRGPGPGRESPPEARLGARSSTSTPEEIVETPRSGEESLIASRGSCSGEGSRRFEGSISAEG